MIKLQVLRYMGVLTVMKLGVFAVSCCSLLLALTWLVINCDLNSLYSPRLSSSKVKLDEHDPRERTDLKIYMQDHSSDGVGFNKTKQYDRISPQEAGKSNIIPYHLYEDESFERLIGELSARHVEHYELLTESENLTIYRKQRGGSGLYEYKLYGIVPSATPEQISAVFLDNEYRLSWDDYVTELYTVQKNNKGPNVIYFNIDLPWPLVNRDYVYAREARREIHSGKEYITIIMHSVLHDSVPLVKGAIRVGDYHQSLVMTKHGTYGSQMYIEYYDDPKGSIPSFLVNWAAKTGVPAFLSDLERACAGHESFLQNRNKTMLTVPMHTN